MLADGFIEELYVPMGCQIAGKYQRVVERTLDGGTLQGDFDRSKPMEDFRDRIRNNPFED